MANISKCKILLYPWHVQFDLLLTFFSFVYGGSTNTTFDLNHSDDEGYLNVYVLSLPAFQWFKSPSTTPVRRACHTCTVIGNRQMVSIGGRLPSSLQSLGAEPDPWGSGIGVFDMTAFEWVDHYDAAAAVYESPEPLKRFYASSYQVPDWSDPTLASIFGMCLSTIALLKHFTNRNNVTSLHGNQHKLILPEFNIIRRLFRLSIRHIQQRLFGKQQQHRTHRRRRRWRRRTHRRHSRPGILDRPSKTQPKPLGLSHSRCQRL